MQRSPLVSLPSTPYSFLTIRSFPPPQVAYVQSLCSSPSDRFFYQRSHHAASLCVTGPRIIEEIVSGTGEDREVEEQKGVSEFIEVGYISSSHGLKGELRVKPSTGFPELRFCKPGRRWLRARVLGKEAISEMQLTGGRSHPGQKCWIVSFDGIDTVDKAKQIVGSSILVREGDRPELEEDEFYTLDLVGMRVVHKETGILVGTVVNVFNSGANDLLHVLRDSSDPSKDRVDHYDSFQSKIDASHQFVWVPFVEAIVPEVDIQRREMKITPPKGLLELNLRSDMRSRKERRQMEWTQRKKLQQSITSAKKRLHKMGQSHLLDGFNFGEKAQKAMLTRQIVDINLQLFQHAVRSIETSSKRLSLYDFVGSNSDLLLKNALRMPYKNPLYHAYPDRNDEFNNRGLQLLQNSEAAIILAINDARNLGNVSNGPMFAQLQQLLIDYKRFLKFQEKRIEIPLILLTPANQAQSCEQLFLDNDFFGFNAQKVLFIKETKLPIISNSAESNRILLKSAWEILQAPTGSGGVFVSVSSHKGVDFLQEMGVEYVQVCALSERCAFGSPLFFGWACSCKADIAVKILEEGKEEDAYDMIFSIGKLSNISKQIEAIPFTAVPEQHQHTELVDGEWLEINPGSPNSYHLHCSIYSTLNSCTIDKICIMQVSE